MQKIATENSISYQKTKKKELCEKIAKFLPNRKDQPIVKRGPIPNSNKVNSIANEKKQNCINKYSIKELQILAKENKISYSNVKKDILCAKLGNMLANRDNKPTIRRGRKSVK